MKKLVKIPFSTYGPMISGQGELESRVYKKIIGKRGIWYIAIQENAADNVYFCSKEDTNSSGFGGATLTFKMEDGTEEQAKGPWHSNSDSLFADTGYDIRDKYFTRGIVAKNHEYAKDMYQPDIYTDVLHYDDVPVLGEFHRIEKIAQEFADNLNCTIYYAVKSSGGGSSAHKKPNNQ